MMQQNVRINYLKNDTYAAVDIPYGNGHWSMVVMLPEEGKTTDDVISLLAQRGLYAKTYSGGEGEMFRPYDVDLKLPRYETSSDTDELPTEKGLVGLLKTMGIKLAFDPLCEEISNMCDVPVYINMMRQKAKVKVNEEGSEAAVITVVGMMKNSAGPMEYPKATFHANRPFVYVIREASSGVILFVGKFTGE
jgi:serpin B